MKGSEILGTGSATVILVSGENTVEIVLIPSNNQGTDENVYANITVTWGSGDVAWAGNREYFSDTASAFNWLALHAEHGGDYTVTTYTDGSIVPTTLYYNGNTVNITLAGKDTARTLSLSGDGSIFTVGSGVTLTLGNNIRLNGHHENTNSLVYVEHNGGLVMNAGSEISGNGTSALGGGVCGYGAFTMNGGAIRNNSTSSQGGGVFIEANFIMNGGEISDNTSYSYGGGVSTNGANFTMNGGSISRNVQTSPYAGGGGVMTSGGTFLMTGGLIGGNRSESRRWGSGVLIWSGNNVEIVGQFLKTGGVIYGSDAEGELMNGPGYAVEVEAATYDNNGEEATNPLPAKRRGSTAGTAVMLDSTLTGSAGGWE